MTNVFAHNTHDRLPEFDKQQNDIKYHQNVHGTAQHDHELRRDYPCYDMMCDRIRSSTLACTRGTVKHVVIFPLPSVLVLKINK